MAFHRQGTSNKGGVGKTSQFPASCVNISKTVYEIRAKLLSMTNRKLHNALSIGNKVDDLG